ncbi:MAG: hypothetical protein ACYSSI_02635 [Planctomycetota bacterium]
MENERRILKLDLFKLSVEDLIGLLRNKALDSEERRQILAELQKRNAGSKRFLE